jgi:hypothetical protein
MSAVSVAFMVSGGVCDAFGAGKEQDGQHPPSSPLLSPISRGGRPYIRAMLSGHAWPLMHQNGLRRGDQVQTHYRPRGPRTRDNPQRPHREQVFVRATAFDQGVHVICIGRRPVTTAQRARAA